MKPVKLKVKNVVNYTVLSLLGLTCLLIYLFYRSEDMMLNQYLLFTFPKLVSIKEAITQWLPLNDFLVYNFPAGLWVFTLTILLKNVQINWYSYRFSLNAVPLGLGLLIELLQFLKLTDGTFDLLDVYTMLAFFMTTQLFYTNTQLEMDSHNRQPILAFIGVAILFFGNNWQ